MRLVVILIFIALVNAQTPLHQQEQQNDQHLNPVNDAAAKEEAAKLQNKRTLFGATHYLPKHIGIHPLGFKYLLGYGPLTGYYPYAKPLSILKPVIHTGGWKPVLHAANVPVFKPIKPIVPVKPHVHVHPVQPVQPVQPIQPVLPVQPAEPEPLPAVIPVEKHVPEPVVPVYKPVVHYQPQAQFYPFYKPLFNPLLPQPNLIQPGVQFHQHLIPQPPVAQPFIPQPHFVHPVQPHVVHPVQPHVVHPVQPHVVHPVQPHVVHPVQPHVVHPVQPLIPQPPVVHHVQPLQPVHPVQPLLPAPPVVHPHVVQPVQPVQPLPLPQPPLPQLPPPFYHILKQFPNFPIFKHITPLFPVNPSPEIPHPIAPSDSGVSVQIPQHLPEHPHFQPPQHIPEQPHFQPPQHIPEQPHFQPPQFPLQPEAGSGHEVHQPDFHTEQHGQVDNPVLIPQPQPHAPVHPHPQTPLYLPPHPVFRPGVANPVGPIEPTNSVHTEFSATFPKHPLIPGLHHPSITLEPPYGPGQIGININKH